jgi:hypothetical protein
MSEPEHLVEARRWLRYAEEDLLFTLIPTGWSVRNEQHEHSRYETPAQRRSGHGHERSSTAAPGYCQSSGGSPR